MEIQLPVKIKERLAYLQDGINKLESKQREIVNIFLDSVGHTVPDGAQWRISDKGESVIIEEYIKE